MSRPSLCAVILLLSCRGATPPPSGLRADALWSDGAGPEGPICGETHTLDFQRRPADVLILFDRSESMLTEFSTGTRYSVVAERLGELVDVYQNKLRFGFQQFPDVAACGGDHFAGCCASGPTVAVALNSGAE